MNKPQGFPRSLLNANRKDITLTTGNNNNVAIGVASYIRFTGASAAWTVTGLDSGYDGAFLVIENGTAVSGTIANLSGSSSGSNQLRTGTGGNLTMTASNAYLAAYNSASNLWLLVDVNPSGGGGGNSFLLGFIFTDLGGAMPFSLDTTVAYCGIGQAWTPSSWYQAFYVATTNDASNYWTFKLVNSGAVTTYASINTSSKGANAWYALQSTSFSPASFVAADACIQLTITKTGNPGAIYVAHPELKVS